GRVVPPHGDFDGGSGSETQQPDGGAPDRRCASGWRRRWPARRPRDEPAPSASVGSYGITATSVSEAVPFAAADLLARPHILKDFGSTHVNQSGMQSPMTLNP